MNTTEPVAERVFTDPVVQLAALCPICALAALSPAAALAAVSPSLVAFNPAINPRAALLAFAASGGGLQARVTARLQGGAFGLWLRLNRSRRLR